MALLAPKPDVVIIALSLGNEGLAHCPKGERRAAQHRFEQGGGLSVAFGRSERRTPSRFAVEMMWTCKTRREYVGKHYMRTRRLKEGVNMGHCSRSVFLFVFFSRTLGLDLDGPSDGCHASAWRSDDMLFRSFQHDNS